MLKIANLEALNEVLSGLDLTKFTVMPSPNKRQDGGIVIVLDAAQYARVEHVVDLKKNLRAPEPTRVERREEARAIVKKAKAVKK